MRSGIPTSVGTALLLCLPLFFSACSTLYYANKLEATTSSSWEGDNFGVYQKYSSICSHDTITVVYTEWGTMLSFGPPFLPIIPLFGGYHPPKHLFDISIWHTYTGNDSLPIHKLQFFANGMPLLEPRVETRYVHTRKDSTKQEEYRLVVYYPLDSLSTLHLCFDSVTVQGTPAQFPPLTLARTKRIRHNFIFTH